MKSSLLTVKTSETAVLCALLFRRVFFQGNCKWWWNYQFL